MYSHKQKLKNKSKVSRSRKLLLIIFLVVLATSLVWVLFVRNNTKKDTPTTNSNNQDIKYAPATPEEKKEAENKKNEIVKKQENQNNNIPTSGTKTNVIPTITNTTGSINAYISGIFEEGGTCSAIFTKDTSSLSKTSVGFQNVSYTQCAPMNLESGFLSSGKWTVVVKYSSDKSEGVSSPQFIEVN